MSTKAIDRRTFLRRSAILGGSLAAMGPLHALGARVAMGAPPVPVPGYGPLVNKGELWLPAPFNYEVISRQGIPMSDGKPTPGIFDGMGAYPGQAGSTILIRNHENRERPGEIKVVTGALEYDQQAFGGNTKLEVRRRRAGVDPDTGEQLYTYEVLRDFAILGGTSTNCAGGLRDPNKWLTCEEVVKRSSNGKKHGYIFEIDAMADGPVPAVPVPQAGRRSHEAALDRAGIVYMTEDRRITPDPLTRKKLLGACFYRYVYTPRGGGVPLHETDGVLEAVKLKDEFQANMDTDRVLGRPYRVEWVTVDHPDHEDDTDDRRDRIPGFIPNRVQAQDKGAAFFDRQEGMWAGSGKSKIYFDCTTGGAQDLGQVWEYDPGRETITLIFESVNPSTLENPDNVVIVPQTADVFLQEDSDDRQFVRALTQYGEIYDFAMSNTNQTEFCGGCFDPDGRTLYLNQQGERGDLPDGPPDGQAVTYAIYGPFEKRKGSSRKRKGTW
ncbi:MAG: PhoX family protein [Actinomycetota bacterium]|nr:PhoX family protein [Actinomycetota bacterium]